MGLSSNHESRPVFVIGSPRSGTSVLTWALGQHPNLLLTEESNWLGSFAVQAAAAYAQGSARIARSQLSALGITRDVFLSGLGGAIDRMIIAGRTHLEAASYATAIHAPQKASQEFAISRDPQESKSRWVDGTPEYSLQIPMLMALFPKAQFVHILRDADQVAASLLAFRDERGCPIVGSAEAAYAYWLRTVRACLDAEEILGPEIIHRVHYADLVTEKERSMRRILDFLAEPFVPACLEPLQRRINSSFAGKAMPRGYPGTHSDIIERARRSSIEWLAAPQPAMANSAGRESWQVEFDTRVLAAQGLETHWESAWRMLSQVRRAFSVCGILFFGNWLLALALWLRFGDTTSALWLAVACAVMLAYVWMRRAGLRVIAMRVLGRRAPSDSQGA